MFGTFLCDSAVERVNEHTDERTFSVWSYLNENNKEIINYLYDDSYDEVLYPNCEVVHMHLWQKLFCDSDIAYLVKFVDKQEMTNVQNFNDSIDGINSIAMSSSPPLDENLNSGSSQRINSLLKNAIDCNSLILNNSIHQNFNTNTSIVKANKLTNQKARSYNDIYKLSNGFGYTSKLNCKKEKPNDNSVLKGLRNGTSLLDNYLLKSSHAKSITKSSSESNLLSIGKNISQTSLLVSNSKLLINTVNHVSNIETIRFG